MNSGYQGNAAETAAVKAWLAGVGDFEKSGIGAVWSRQGWGTLNTAKSVIDAPLTLGDKQYQWGFGTHADSEILIRSTSPLKTFRAWVGIDRNASSLQGVSECRFSIWRDEVCLAESGPLNVHSEPEMLTADLGGAISFTLKVKTSNTISYGHVDWAECEAVTVAGEVLKLGDPATPPFRNLMPVSFQYGDWSSDQWFQRWGVKHSVEPKDGFTLHQFVTQDTETGLECRIELQEYDDVPAVLWNVTFANRGDAPTPILAAVKTLDLLLPASGEKKLYRARGSFHDEAKLMNAEAFRDNFMLQEEDLSQGEIVMGGVGGRSSVDWMPYFNFAAADRGVMFGIGWTGQWQARVSESNSGFNVAAGMEFLHTRLNPGESIRQPATLMIFWQGDPIKGHNFLRRFITHTLAPRYDGQPLQAPITHGSWGAMPAADHLKRIALIQEQKLPYDYYWIDAGWYGPDCDPEGDTFSSQWVNNAGNWRINAKIYPQGFRPLSDAARQAGMKFLLWFEPERAICGTPITREHPEYFLDLGTRIDGQALLLDLGNPEARKWCTELIAGMIETQNIGCYRQDFNFSPLPFWQAGEDPDRVGIREIRYVEGLYGFLDELRRRFPDLLIDNCASGGRRLDFEMMRRSIPLWASDMQCFPDYVTERNQQQVAGLSLWIPQFSFGTEVAHPGDTYHFRSALAGGVVAHLFPSLATPIDPAYPMDWLRARMEEYHRAKIYFSGDFYPLTEQTASFRYWTANQFYRPDLDAGILMVFRKPQSDIEKMRFRLAGLDPERDYELEDADSGAIVKATGRALAEAGFPVEMDRPRESKLYFFRAVAR